MALNTSEGETAANTPSLRPFDGGFGAELSGVDLRGPSDVAIGALRRAVLEHGVVFVRDQPMTDEEHLALGSRFGSLSVFPVLRVAGVEQPLEFLEDTEDNPPKADRWHSDLTWIQAPPKFAFLSMLIAPDEGGDTMWADTQGAFDALDVSTQDALREHWVRHRAESGAIDRFLARYGPDVSARFRAEYGDAVEHPLVRRNPDTGHDALFLGGYWMERINGLAADDSDALLRQLHEHATQPRFTVRWKWRPHDLAVWDERRTLHRAVGDHWPRHRKVRRCTVDGDVPRAASVDSSAPAAPSA